ncbi:MAG: hypothetical protein IBX47_00055 [Desulfuromonadales bacterium]|nr:hypothetical protein [Desulfuromonadales bacterium]
MSKQPINTNEKPGIFDKPENVKRLLRIFYLCVILLLIVDIFYHKHTYFAWEGYFGFYSVYGFVACVILVIVSKYILRPMVMRKEDHYDD